MSRRTRFFSAVLAALAIGALAASLVIASGDSGNDATASKVPKGFSPAKFKGKWVGKWENQTFHTEGEIRANIQAKPKNKMVMLIDFSGNVFGCPAPSGAPHTLKKGTGKNHWSSSGFSFSQASTPVFGAISLTYKFAKKSLTGSGSAPPCNSAYSYTLEGKLTPKALNATVHIDLGGGQTATTVLSATKQ